MTLREQFVEWARDAAGLDTSLDWSDSAVARVRFTSSDTRIAWEAWRAATYEATQRGLNDHT